MATGRDDVAETVVVEMHRQAPRDFIHDCGGEPGDQRETEIDDSNNKHWLRHS